MAEDEKDRKIELLEKRLALLESCGPTGIKAADGYFYAARNCTERYLDDPAPLFPETGMPARFCETLVKNYHEMDHNEMLNTSSYVNVVFEPEEERVARLGMRINIADQTVYPVTFKVHDNCVNLIANLWNCPSDDQSLSGFHVHPGAGTVGSSEACLLAGLALKFRWRHWYAARKGLTASDVRRETPNIVISSMYQACWEKFFKYMDVEARLVHPSVKAMTLDPSGVEALIDDHTIGVVCIMGNHYSGHYDPVHDVDAVVARINAAKGLQVGIHVDAASGGFIAPFQDGLPPWDFRLPNVLSISASGHKFGESVCGTGWVIWRQRKTLSEHIAVSVSYLGGQADSYTLNFSRPASGILVQFYKFHRLGRQGFAAKVRNQMETAAVLRHGLAKLKAPNGQLRFIILDGGDSDCLPVVAAALNPAAKLSYTDVDLQHAISDEQWYVCAYRMAFHHPELQRSVPLFFDAADTDTMFRVVVKSNITTEMAYMLLDVIARAAEWLDVHSDGMKLPQRRRWHRHRRRGRSDRSDHGSVFSEPTSPVSPTAAYGLRAAC